MLDEAFRAKAAAMTDATAELARAGKSASPEVLKRMVESGHAFLDHVDATQAKRWADIAEKLKAMQPSVRPPIGGMKVSTAVLGTVAVAGGVYLASKLFSKPKERQSNWADRVRAEQATAQAQHYR